MLLAVFATSHELGACDGVGSTVKRATALGSLRRPTTDQITNAAEMFEFLNETLPSYRSGIPARIEGRSWENRRRAESSLQSSGAGQGDIKLAHLLAGRH